VDKVLENKKIEADMFTFKLTEVDVAGKAIEGGIVITTTNDVNGHAQFDTLAYELTVNRNDTGTHYYQITEVLPEGATADNNYTFEGIKYDPTVYTVTAQVVDSTKGYLIVNKTITADNQTGELDGIKFTNIATAKLQITKVLEDYSKTLEGAVFAFEVTGSNGYKNTLGVTLSETGTVQSDILEGLELADGITYTIKEVYTGSTYKTDKDTVVGTIVKGEDGLWTTDGSDADFGLVQAADGTYMITAQFTNTYEDTGRGGNGVVNSYNNNGDVDQRYNNAQ
ncbi:MAG: hypothetical protein HUJ56_05805, partial [Erysipelotrichaceae bacterium]|nr:hypothetical protein [Erysipelotrichaceae bacterium]